MLYLLTFVLFKYLSIGALFTLVFCHIVLVASKIMLLLHIGFSVRFFKPCAAL